MKQVWSLEVPECPAHSQTYRIKVFSSHIDLHRFLSLWFTELYHRSSRNLGCTYLDLRQWGMDPLSICYPLFVKTLYAINVSRGTSKEYTWSLGCTIAFFSLQIPQRKGEIGLSPGVSLSKNKHTHSQDSWTLKKGNATEIYRKKVHLNIVPMRLTRCFHVLVPRLSGCWITKPSA